MKRYGLVILFFIVLVTPFVLKRALGTGTSSRNASGGLQLVIVTPHGEGIKREYANAFSDWHQQHFGQPVTIDYRSYGGGSEIVRFFRASDDLFKRIGTYKIDLVWGGGDYLFDVELKKKTGCLEPLTLPDELMRKAYPSQQLNGANLYDPAKPPAWFGTALSAFGIVYNKDVLHHLDVPEPAQWRDLADPRLAGWFVAADPTRSASARQAFMIITELAMIDASAAGRTEDIGWAEGMGLIRRICANARYFTDGSGSVPSVISTGDSAVGMAIDYYGRSQVDAVGESRMGYIEPVGATAINSDPIAMVKGAEHRELAIRFIEFVLSEQGQRLWNTRAGAPGGPKSTSLRRLPVMRDVYRSPTNFTDAIDPFGAKFAFASSNERKKTFNVIGDLIEMSCMNLLDELRQTRRAILQSPRRDELEAKLGMFPFDQKEALRRAALYDKASAVEKLALKRKWEAEFREEYRRLREEARN